MNTQEQLRWQDRFAVPAAVAAFVAVVAQIATIVLLATALEDRAGIEPLADEYLSIDERPGQFIAGGVARAVGALAIGVVFYYLFRLIRARGGAVPQWFVYLVYAGPLLFAVGAILGCVRPGGHGPAVHRPERDQGRRAVRRSPENLSDDTSPAVYAPTFAGTIGVAFLFVMLPLRARAVGLLSPFMAILGVICGALLVLPLVPVADHDRLLAGCHRPALPRPVARRTRAGLGVRGIGALAGTGSAQGPVQPARTAGPGRRSGPR